MENYATFEQIALLLGDDWVFNKIKTEEDNYLNRPHLTKKDLLMIFKQEKGKWNIFAYSKDIRTRYAGSIPSINVSVNKSPSQIAQDIKRRLLPEIEKFAQKVEKHKKEEGKRVEWLQLIAHNLKKVFTKLEHWGANSQEYENDLRFYEGSGDFNARIKLSGYSQRIDFEINNITPEMACEICAILQKNTK